MQSWVLTPKCSCLTHKWSWTFSKYPWMFACTITTERNHFYWTVSKKLRSAKKYMIWADSENTPQILPFEAQNVLCQSFACTIDLSLSVQWLVVPYGCIDHSGFLSWNQQLLSVCACINGMDYSTMTMDHIAKKSYITNILIARIFYKHYFLHPICHKQQVL